MKIGFNFIDKIYNLFLENPKSELIFSIFDILYSKTNIIFLNEKLSEKIHFQFIFEKYFQKFYELYQNNKFSDRNEEIQKTLLIMLSNTPHSLLNNSIKIVNNILIQGFKSMQFIHFIVKFI